MIVMWIIIAVLVAMLVCLICCTVSLEERANGYKRQVETLNMRCDCWTAKCLETASWNKELEQRAEEAERKNEVLQELRQRMNERWQSKLNRLAGKLGAMTQKYNKLKSKEQC